MRGYATVNRLTGDIASIQSWKDDRDYPSDIPIDPETAIITIADVENSPVKQDHFRYDFTGLEFVEFTPDPPAPPQPTELELLKEQMAVNQGAIDFIIMNF